MMEPTWIAIELAKLGYEIWRDSRQRGEAMLHDGTTLGGSGRPAVGIEGLVSYVDPRVDGWFGAIACKQVAENFYSGVTLNEDHVSVVVFDEATSPFWFAVPILLGEPFQVLLKPGRYLVSSFVYSNTMELAGHGSPCAIRVRRYKDKHGVSLYEFPVDSLVHPLDAAINGLIDLEEVRLEDAAPLALPSGESSNRCLARVAAGRQCLRSRATLANRLCGQHLRMAGGGKRVINHVTGRSITR